MGEVACVECALLIAFACGLEVSAHWLEHRVGGIAAGAVGTRRAAWRAVLAQGNDLSGSLHRAKEAGRGEGEQRVVHSERGRSVRRGGARETEKLGKSEGRRVLLVGWRWEAMCGHVDDAL